MSDTLGFNLTHDISKNQMDSFEYLEHYDVNLNNADANTDFNIEINDVLDYLLPHKSFLKIDFQLKQNNGANFGAGTNVSLQNNAVGIFKRWILDINTKEIETVDDAHICNTIQKLVYYSDEHSSTIATSQLWYPDTTNTTVNEYTITPTITDHLLQYSADAGGTWTDITNAQLQYVAANNSIAPVGTGIANGNIIRVKPHAVTGVTLNNGSETVNYGHRKRQQLLDGSKVFSVRIPLSHVFGLFKSYKGLMKGLRLCLRLERNSNDDLVLAPGNNGKVVLESVKWYMPRVKPSLALMGALTKELAGAKKFTIPFTDFQLYRSNKFGAGPHNNKIFQIRCKRRSPLRIFIAFQTEAVYTGDKTQVKRVFSNVGLTRLRAVLNGTVQYPERELETTFAAARKDYSRAYNMFLQCGLKIHGDVDGSIVKYDNFETLYPIFCIDMTNKAMRQDTPNNALIDIYVSAQASDFYAYCIVESQREWYVMGDNGILKHLGTDLMNKQ